ncbi:glycosyltransferase [Calidifontibacter sp. DB0510]|uniref:Glycosyltransferase n=1 Tax=Metallococcus carri TaxID=1656884 RepID=A0A967AZB6_9MICO|nr:glycosyltransferase [Metallococcus carri]NHN54508.1 glycosyltransferase [Metallococcus carri]NOP36653.1 glycosyltransferase [Calidifontibacter sp. DB2511S]
MTVHVVVGPERHGVVAHARLLLRQPALTDDQVIRAPDARRASECLRAHRSAHVHLHFTDRLFGGVARAASAVAALTAGHSFSVTLHDLPQASDGQHFAARRATYLRIAQDSSLVVVSSAHEARLLHALGPLDTPVEVVPLPITPPQREARPDGDAIAMAGFVYPGKGHERVLAAMAGLPPSARLLNLGAPSEGHAELADRYAARAARLGRDFSCSGYLSEPDLLDAMATVRVPVAAPEHVSASGSLTVWNAAGRRPLTTRNAFAREVAARNPHALRIVDDLPAAVERAWHEPEWTVLPRGVELQPTPASAARRVAQTLATVATEVR